MNPAFAQDSGPVDAALKVGDNILTSGGPVAYVLWVVLAIGALGGGFVIRVMWMTIKDHIAWMRGELSAALKERAEADKALAIALNNLERTIGQKG